MRVFLIAALCTSLAYAKPQYNYPAPSVPSGSYGTPGGGGGGGSSSFSTGGSFSSGSGGFGGGSGISSSQSGFGGGSGGGFGGGSGGGFGGGSGGSFGGGSGGGFGSSSGGGFATSGEGGTIVQKHIYVHVAPPEPEESRPQRPIAAGQSTKNYKIIFIKAPSYQPTQQQILQAQAQNEEKTLVYVLVKKPDDVADVTLPTAAPTAPSKPEVYFIRYKAKSEVSGGVGGGVGVGGGAAIGGGAGIGGGSGFGSGGSGFSSSSGSSSAGDSVSGGRPATSYGPPGQSGPY